MYKRTFKRNRKELMYSFSGKEYTEFLSRFRGSLIFRGKSSFSYKWMDKIFLKFKKTFGINTDFLFKKALRNLVPFVGYKKVKMGKKVYPLPILLHKKKRHMLLINWLLKDVKNKSNVRGYRFKDVWENLYDSLYNKGSIIEKKGDYLDKSLEFLYLFRRRRWRRKGKTLHIKNKFKLKRYHWNNVIENFYRKNKIALSNNPLSLLAFRYSRLKYTSRKKPGIRKLFKNNLKRLWFNKTLSYNSKSKLLCDFLYGNKRHIQWKGLKNSGIFSYYLKNKKKEWKKKSINKI